MLPEAVEAAAGQIAQVERRGAGAPHAARRLAGTGIAVDAVVSDFISGAAERLTLEAASAAGSASDSGGASDAGEAEIVLVEGQGSLMHPGYSGVTLGLLHGTLPQAMILTWMPSRPRIYGGNHSWVEIPDLDEVIRRYEGALAWACPDIPGRVIGVSLATYDISEEEARAAVRHAREVTGLPATDPIRFAAPPGRRDHPGPGRRYCRLLKASGKAPHPPVRRRASPPQRPMRHR